MCNYVQVVLLAMVVCSFHVQCQTQGFTYSTYSNPYQNSFAFSTPNLKQMFTTKLANAPTNQLNQLQLQDQQYYNNLAQQNSFIFPEQQPNRNIFPQSANLYSTAPQQFASQDDQLRQQLAYLQLQQLQQQQYQFHQQQQLQQQQQQQQQTEYEQFQQAPFYPSSRDASQQAASFERQQQQQQQQQQEELRTQNLLGVAYSPSTKVSQVKFDSGKLKYDF